MFQWFFKLRSYDNEIQTRTMNTQIWVTMRAEGNRPAEDFEEVTAWVSHHRDRIDSQEYGDTCDLILDSFPRAKRVKVTHGGRHFGAIACR